MYLPTEGLAACEIIDRMAVDAYQHVVLSNPHESYVIEEGQIKTRYDLLYKWEYLINFMRGHCKCARGSVPDYSMLAMAAVGEAWYLINDLKEKLQRESDPETPGSLLLARGLIARAFEIRTLGEKKQIGAEYSARQSHAARCKGKPEREKIKSEAQAILKSQGRLSTRKLAEQVTEKLYPELVKDRTDAGPKKWENKKESVRKILLKISDLS